MEKCRKNRFSLKYTVLDTIHRVQANIKIEKLQFDLFKFATGVVDNGGTLHLNLRISPRIFGKIRNGPNGMLWG